MKIIQLLIVAALISISTMVIGQNEKFIAAENFFLHGYYSDAAPLYTELLKTDSSDVYLNFKTGLCYLNSRSQKYKAVYYFQQAVSPVGTFNNAYATPFASACINNLCGAAGTDKNNVSFEIIRQISYRFLGDAYYFINEFDRAIVCYERYRISLNKKSNKALADDLNTSIYLCFFGKNLKLSEQRLVMPVRKEIFIARNVYRQIHFPELSFSDKLNKEVTKTLMDNSIELLKKEPVSVFGIRKVSNKNCFGKAAKETSVKGNETTIGTSTDGQMVLVYRVTPDGLGNLYTTRLMNNTWTKPEKLDKILNTTGWETGEFISVDGSTMYFTSDKPGGYGGRDIYCSKKNADGTWSKEENLGPAINTRYDEDAPFIYPNGTTLYFRSDGHRASGCYDILLSSLSDSGWTAPVNVGYPVDISSDELVETGYTGTTQSKMEQENTNYLATFFNLEKVPLTLVKRHIIDNQDKPVEDVKITIAGNDGNVTAVYNSNRGSGDYLFLLPGSNNGAYIHYEAKGYFFQSEYIAFGKTKNMYESFKPVRLTPISEGSAIALNTIYFAKQELALKSEALPELDHLASFLSDNSSVSVKVVGYADDAGSSKANKKVALERAKVLADYLANKGVDKKRITVKGYGKLKQKAQADAQQRYVVEVQKT